MNSWISPQQPAHWLGWNSFRYKGEKIWNDLPNKIKNSITLAEFKIQIKNGKDQSVFAICAQDCYWMQLI